MDVFEGYDANDKFVCNVQEVTRKIKEHFAEYDINLDLGHFMFSSIFKPDEIRTFLDMNDAFDFAKEEAGAIRFSSPLVFEGVENKESFSDIG